MLWKMASSNRRYMYQSAFSVMKRYLQYMRFTIGGQHCTSEIKSLKEQHLFPHARATYWNTYWNMTGTRKSGHINRTPNNPNNKQFNSHAKILHFF